MINPKIIKKSIEKMRVWDDCFSFPDLLVKMERAKEIEVEYQTKDGVKHSITAKGDLSELFSMRSTTWLESWRFNGRSTENHSLSGASGKNS